jgi:hypothetical protein
MVIQIINMNFASYRLLCCSDYCGMGGLTTHILGTLAVLAPLFEVLGVLGAGGVSVFSIDLVHQRVRQLVGAAGGWGGIEI